MDELLKYINALPPADRAAFCNRCATTEGYLRKAVSVGGRLGESLCINIERETGGAIKVEALRPDVDWAVLRTCQCVLAA